MAAPRKYPEELRERAIRMAVDLRRDPGTRTGALRRVGEQLGINPEALRNWVTQVEVDEGRRPGVTSAEARRVVELERGGPRAAQGQRDPQDGIGVFRRGGARPPTEIITAVLVAYIDEHRAMFGVEPICEVLTEAGTKIAPSTYYAAKTRSASARSVTDAATTEVIRTVHDRNQLLRSELRDDQHRSVSYEPPLDPARDRRGFCQSVARQTLWQDD